ncbi:MAG: PQQ-binding-like beta-propeller repeat protein [Candidatus Sumerlaeota bacterium]|nr:PQQ-binding-like beta-propeller repeat protein [Candidatus Sumerlaeota bacterium]
MALDYSSETHAKGSGWIIVKALAASGSTVYVSGSFQSMGGQARQGLAALDAATGAATDWNPAINGWAGDASAIAASDSTVYVGGSFSEFAGQPRRHAAAFDAETGKLTQWDPSPDEGVEVLTLSGSTVYAAGNFSHIGGEYRHGLAAVDALTGSATAWNPDLPAGDNGRVRALAVSGATVYAGGGFTSIGGQPRNGLAALDAVSGLATAWDPNPTSAYAKYPRPIVLSLAVSRSTLFVGGRFSGIAGQPASGIAALNAATGAALDWRPDLIAGVHDDFPGVDRLVADDSGLYMTGPFVEVGGQYSPKCALFGSP